MWSEFFYFSRTRNSRLFLQTPHSFEVKCVILALMVATFSAVSWFLLVQSDNPANTFSIIWSYYRPCLVHLDYGVRVLSLLEILLSDSYECIDHSAASSQGLIDHYSRPSRFIHCSQLAHKHYNCDSAMFPIFSISLRTCTSREGLLICMNLLL